MRASTFSYQASDSAPVTTRTNHDRNISQSRTPPRVVMKLKVKNLPSILKRLSMRKPVRPRSPRLTGPAIRRPAPILSPTVAAWAGGIRRSAGPRMKALKNIDPTSTMAE